MRIHPWLLAMIGCAGPDDTAARIVLLPVEHHISVAADGTINRRDVHVRAGDTVVWDLAAPELAIVPVVGGWRPDARTPAQQPLPYTPDAVNYFLGPMPDAPGGVFALNPNLGDAGLVETTTPCPDELRSQHGATYLCATGAPGAVMADTWSDPSISGVFLRVAWSDVEPGDGELLWDALDREIDQAVANGKLYSLAIVAGRHGTPDWVLDRVPTVELDEGTVAVVTDAEYGRLYRTMLRALADHLAERGDRYRALAYIKPSGANRDTAENRLPVGCDAGRPICDAARWAGAGYRPEVMEAFYADQELTMATRFPTKVMSYALIQDGFPRVDANGNSLDATGTWVPDPSGVHVGPFEQTVDIIDAGAVANPGHFAVQHNGLQPLGEDTCPDNGCPNQWVLDYAAAHPDEHVGFQTQNLTEIATTGVLDAALLNAQYNSTAIFVEVYEELVWLARVQGGSLEVAPPGTPIPVSRTLAWWNVDFRARRGPAITRHSFRVEKAAPGTTYYYVEAKNVSRPVLPASITIDE